ncbi:BlaR1 peptidase M56 [Flavobacterium succinicans]|uniref:BlaR1 peptidase M56 n=1 Tax=Flavobacterium succinicans TaxID=29536 RepID=A0A1I4YNB9_9FLAO|nr:M56 family metallopeptidase [Flavobacterium succinicans]SFN39079.1 BlaR1 peptidase M56 [Flavobacterium succinicans]
METIYIYLLKASGLIALFYLAYYFLLRKETFFTANRFFLLAGLGTAVVLPLFYITKIVWVNPTPLNFPISELPLQQATPEESFEINWYLTAIAIYILGSALFFIKFGMDYWSLNRVLNKSKAQQQADFKLIDVPEKIAPFSYFNTIVFNSSLYSPSELQSILEHEKVHSEQHHTIDVLIIRFFSIVFWFNPFIWLYQRAILQNLEFIADNEATKRLDDKKAYQMALLKITTHENCVALTNHFYQSLIKKRIVMLNKNQSKKWNSWKYALILPALIAFVFIFQIKVLAQEKTVTHTTTSKTTTEDIILVIDKNTSDVKLKQEAQLLKDLHGINLKISKVKRNANQEITGIKVQFDDKNGNKGTNQVDSDRPISPITFIKNTDSKGKSSIGFYTGKANPKGKINKKIVLNSSDDEESNFAFSFSDDEEDLTPPDAPSVPDATDAPDAPDAPNQPKVQIQKRVIVTRSNNGEKPIVYINGKKVDVNMEELNSKLDPKSIERMDVYKGDISIEKYGDDGKNGVIAITTKDGRTEVNVNKIIKRAQADVERSLNDRENMQADMERARKEIELSKIEMQKAKAEIEKAKQEILKAKKEIEKAKAENNKI